MNEKVDINKQEESKDQIHYRYKFSFENGEEKEFTVKLDSETLNLDTRRYKEFPEWVELEKFRCSNCTLDGKEHKYCPAALSLVGIVERFKDSISYETVKVDIETEARCFSKTTSLQEGINALIGIIMVTSGCPVLEKLKPMVRVHIPFSTMQERIYRVLTMYLLAQYYVEKWGGSPDWNFENLVSIFDDVCVINKNFCDKLSGIMVKDATINALISLDSFAAYTSFHITENMLNILESSFDAYLRKYDRRKDGVRKKIENI